MTRDELIAAIRRQDDDNEEFLRFERIEKPLHRRPDICAFLMLDAALPDAVMANGEPGDMVCCAEHDEIWLDVDLDELAAVATADMIRDLVRCGVRFDTGAKSLAMFV